MGFPTVYETLKDVFPEVDWRLLRSVAIEHSNDVDAAAENVLSEIIPFLASQAKTVFSSPPSPSKPLVFSPPSASQPVGFNLNLPGTSQPVVSRPPSTKDCSSNGLYGLPEEGSAAQTDMENDEDEEGTNLLRCRQVGLLNTMGSSSGPANDNSSETGLRSDTHHLDPVYDDEKVLNHPTGLSCETNNTNQFQGIPISDTHQLQGNIEGEELILLGEPQHHGGSCCVSHVESASLIQENGSSCSGSLTNHNSEYSEWKDFDGPLADDSDVIILGKSPQVELGAALEVDNSVAEQAPEAAEVAVHSESSSIFNNDCENMSSKQVSKIDLLEEMVEDAKNNKQTLRSAIDSVLHMMRLVESQEKDAEQAKAESARGGLDILIKVEELKQMLAHAKEANNMHAGEVYGEKAILATEARELQARLHSMSDERDKALAILDEMNQTLEARLAAAEELRKAAKQEEQEKEESARNALREQQAIMEVVVQESKILEQQAEENSKLREFLMDRGRVVDKLQGEISVACQEVRLLKEKFDEGVLLTKSMSSSQISCVSASSGSSHKTVAELVPEAAETSEAICISSVVDRSLGLSHESMTELVPEAGEISKEIPTPCVVDRSLGLSHESMTELVPEVGETCKTPREVSPRSSIGGQSPASSHKSFEILGEVDNSFRSHRVTSPTFSSAGDLSPDTRLENERLLNNLKEAMDSGWDFLDDDM